ncbi:MAG: AAA family ATPase [Gammaproteobacteria bacterium]|nr:AAA family ATPase [Gammaproteobacteria bacterium]
MQDIHDLELLFRARIPIVVVESQDEKRALKLFAPLSERMGVALSVWTVTDGLARVDRGMPPQKHNAEPIHVLGHIKSSELPGIYVLVDFHPYLEDPILVRSLKDIATEYDQVKKIIVLLSHKLVLPDELRRYSARFELGLPDSQAIKKIVESVAVEWKTENGGQNVKADPEALRMLINNLRGLTHSDVRRLTRKAIYDDGAITQADLPKLAKAKHRLLDKSGALTFEYDTAHFADVGGLSQLKGWLDQRKAFYGGKKAQDGLDSPKGILLLGVQGCGKSLAAKAVSGIFGTPLLRLDFGTLYNKYYGETERNLCEALQTAEAMAPCVLWMDEIEKGLAPQGSDDGLERRVLGTLLTWMAENKSAAFLVATANNIKSLPPELIRKGRFDEIFFIDLPGAGVRQQILNIHLHKRGLPEADFDLALLAEASKGFTGAELEQAIVSVLYTAHANDQEPNTMLLLDEIERTRPLSVVMAEQVNALRAWAEGRTVPAD